MSVQSGLESLERTVSLNRNKGDALIARGRRSAPSTPTGSARNVPTRRSGCLGSISVADRDPAPYRAGSARWTLRSGWEYGAGCYAASAELGQPDTLEDALESYRRGARIETKYELSSTYNRTNALKLALITGTATVAQERDALVELRDVLDRRLAADVQAADDAWLWADLGDVTLLLGTSERRYRLHDLRREGTDELACVDVERPTRSRCRAQGAPRSGRVRC